MNSAESSPQSSPSRKKTGSGKQPLYIRLYFRPHMTELVQLLGYRDVPLEEIKPQLASLDETYGHETMVSAAEELVETVVVTQTFARLKEEVRRVARQILGPPPSPTEAPVSLVSMTTPPVPSRSPTAFNDQPENSIPPDPGEAPSASHTSSAAEEQRLAAYEAHEELLYCCDRPKLRWFGEIGDLSVACESCGYVLFAHDELMPDGEPPGIMIDADESALAGQ